MNSEEYLKKNLIPVRRIRIKSKVVSLKKAFEAVRMAKEEALEFDVIKEALQIREKKVLQEVREWLVSKVGKLDAYHGLGKVKVWSSGNDVVADDIEEWTTKKLIELFDSDFLGKSRQVLNPQKSFLKKEKEAKN